MSSFGATTATGLSSLLDGQISHDQVTRFLSQVEYPSKELCHQVKSVVRTIEREDGVLIFDDTIQEKPYTDENERMNPFALRSKLYLKAIRLAFEELQQLKAA